MSNQLYNKHEIRPRLGSFWYEQIAPDQERGVLAMQHSTDHSQAQNLLQASGDWALGAEYTVENDIHLHYDPREVVLDSGFWEVPLDRDLDPVSLLTENGDILLRGLGFESVDGKLKFLRHPDYLFNNNRILVKSARVWRRNLISYTMQLDSVGGPVNYVRDYYRGSQSPRKFELALAQATGLKIIPRNGFLYSSRVFGSSTVYEFDFGEVTVPYAHDALEVNRFYKADTVIGNQISIHASNAANGSGDSGGYDLYDNLLDWSGGLSLNGICPIPGIALPDLDIDYVTESAPGGNLHLRFETQFNTPPTDDDGYVVYDGSGVLFGDLGNISSLIATDQEQSDRFHRWMHDNEDRSGIYLNSLLDAPHTTAGESGTVNLLRFMFQHILGRRALVVDLKTHTMGRSYHRRALKFIRREKPIGSIPIVRILESGYTSGGTFTEWDGFDRRDDTATWIDDLYWDDSQGWDDKTTWIDDLYWDDSRYWVDSEL